MKLFLISLGTLLITVLIGLIVKFWGLGLEYKSFKHPFFESTKTNSPPNLAQSKPPSDVESLPPSENPSGQLVLSIDPQNSSSHTLPIYTLSERELEEQLADSPTVIDWKPRPVYGLLISVYSSSEGTLFPLSKASADLIIKKIKESGKFKGRYIHDYDLQTLISMDPVVRNISSWMNDYPPNTRFIFNFLSNHSQIHKNVIAFIENHNLAERAIISSEVDLITKKVKEERPMWAFGSSVGEVTRLQTFSTVGLESALSIRGDLFVCPRQMMKRKFCSLEIAREVLRRKKHLLLL